MRRWAGRRLGRGRRPWRPRLVAAGFVSSRRRDVQFVGGHKRATERCSSASGRAPSVDGRRKRRTPRAYGPIMVTLDFRLAPSGFRATDIDELVALIEGIGAPCYASGPTAGALHRFDGYGLRRPFDVVLERGRQAHRAAHNVHTTIELGSLDVAAVGGIPVLSPTRTIIDLARTSTRPQLAAAIDSALRDGGTSEDFLFRRIGQLRGQGRYGLPALLEVLEGKELTRGGASWLEREVLRLLDAAGLPRPTTQAVVAKRGAKLIRVDFRFPGTRVLLEALGYRWHRSPAQLQSDVARINELQLAGLLVLQCTYADAVAGAEATLDDVRRALALPTLLSA